MKKRDYNPMKFILIIVAFLVISILVVFGFERGVIYYELHNPFLKPWVSIHMTDGQIVYGHFAGINKETIKLINVRMLEKFTKDEAEQDLSQSSTFSLNAQAPKLSEDRFIIKKEQVPIFLNRGMVLSWEFLPQNIPLVVELEK